MIKRESYEMVIYSLLIAIVMLLGGLIYGGYNYHKLEVQCIQLMNGQH